MTPEKLIQAMMERFEEKFGITLDWGDGDLIDKENLSSFLRTEAIQLVRDAFKAVEVKEVDCEEPGYQIPESSELAADQAFNKALSQVESKKEAFITSLTENK